MLKCLSNRLLWASLLTFTLSQASPGQERINEKPPPMAAAKGCEDPGAALSALQAAHLRTENAFIVQDDLEGLIDPQGGGACASAAGIDILQTLRFMSGLDALSNPHKAAIAAFKNQPALLKGRVSNEQFVKLIEFYERYLDKSKLRISVDSAPNSGYRLHLPSWNEAIGPNLSVAARTIKILSYTVTQPNGVVLGRHFVLLKAIADNRIDVVDPFKPLKDRIYLLEYKPGDKGPKARVLLNNPPEFPRGDKSTYELNTVFTVTIEERAGGLGQQPGPGSTVESVNHRVDTLAKELKGTKQFLDPRVWRKRGAEFGLPGLDLPMEHGGSAWPAVKMVEIFRHAGEYNLNFRDAVGGGHVRPLLKSKNPEILDIVKKVAKGEGYVAIAITEPGAGSDVPAIQSTSKKVPGGYVLNGTKRFNARLDQASHVIIFTQGTTGKPGKLSVFVLPIKTPGLNVETLEAHGLVGNSYGGLNFKELFVPETALVGNDGEGLKVFREHFLYWRLMQAATAIGTGEDALSQMAKRIKTREAFGGPIGRFTHLQQPLGQHKTELLMARALALEAAILLDQGDFDAAEPLINGLKAEGVEIALRAADAAARAYGGEGYSTLVDVGDRVKDLNGLRIADGTTDVMRMLVVRQIFGEEFWQMAVQKKREP